METSVSSVLSWQKGMIRVLWGLEGGGGVAHRGQNRAETVDRGTEIPTEKDKVKHADIHREGLITTSYAGGHWESLELAGLGCEGSLFRFVEVVSFFFFSFF